MARTAKRKSNRQRIKDETWKWMSKYVRLRDCVEYTKKHPSADNEYAPCCTCGEIKHWKRADAGHFIGRGIGGSSGVYFDERNVNFQCKRCNGFLGGNQIEYEKFMIRKYGKDVVDHLKILHKAKIYTFAEILFLGIYYKQKFEEL